MMDETLKMIQDIIDGKLKSGMPITYWELEKTRLEILDELSHTYHEYLTTRELAMRKIRAIAAQQTDILNNAHLLRETK